MVAGQVRRRADLERPRHLSLVREVLQELFSLEAAPQEDARHLLQPPEDVLGH